ncbi:fluoride efflux transporter CrcB [Oceanospirillum sediminis]|uniref:Fluoride-specific ion channel FluC n=1 Tax=Oceanospirillum sediminis TaxID=2760088 RepID=A0A839IU70_9GAMM|nr:fluoride efflux transporter CrcB [Oceanospirillum sediminis]MBB1488488.1 fluoride efflux transporter CrcB [Oceanospirillum sediminis]
MNQMLAVAIGGAVGAMGRYWIVGLATQWFGKGFPYGTMLVNVAGSVLIGVLYSLIVQHLKLEPHWQAVLMTGFTGAFTTFSTFALESLNLFQSGRTTAALVYIVLSVICCLAAVAVGIWLGKQLA